jgi:HEAT repeat protein
VRKLAILGVLLVLAGCAGRPTQDWIEQLGSKDGSERLHAIRALSERPADAEAIVPALSAVLKDRDPFVRRDAALALAKLGTSARGALPALQPLLKDHNRQVRRAASEAVKKVNPEG